MKRNIKERLYEIVFEADTKAGKYFDIILVILILISIICVCLESIPSIHNSYNSILKITEWTITLLFTIEYFLRIIIIRSPVKYIKSFFGIIDLLSVLPTYIGLFIAGAHGLIVIRALRLLRIFRILKLTRYLNESRILLKALKSSRVKIGVFLFAVLTLVIIIGTVMYLIEGEKNGFTSIPKSIYWAIVTLTTVGYGDLTPQTSLGQFISGLVMILGYGIIAVPTGIVSVEISNAYKKDKISTQVCPSCLKEGHESDALYCKYCGSKINN